MENVFGVPLDEVRSFNRAQVDSANRLGLEAVFDLDWFLRQRIGANCAGRDGLRRVHVLLHQHGRDGQNAADVVEAVAGIVGREIFLGAKVDAQ